ncbi:carbohydrate ABC transporter substrate-binding protein [Ruminococcus sp. AF42-9BH]|nr:carbohydrate ABC transporter substrate-binding protein [Ruminococcus sp. AF42-9BH]
MKVKKSVALTMAAALTFGLVVSNGTVAKAADVVEIKFPTYLAGENVGAQFFLPEVERFNEKYEGKYKITVEEVPQASYADKIKQLAQQNKLPVLVHAPGSGGIDTQWFKQVVLANDMAYDLSSFAEENPDVAANWVDESVDFCTVDGKLICKPLSVIKPVGLYYNSSMYTADKDIKDMSVDEFMDSLGDNKIAFQTAENGWTTALLLAALIGNEEGGADLLNNNADDKLWDYTAEPFVNGVAKLQTLLEKNASSNTIGAAYADAANAFMSKGASIICNGSWMASEFDAESSDKWSNDFSGDDVKATIYPGNIAIVNQRNYGEFWISNNASDEEKEAAEAFLAFRDSQEEIEALILAEGGSAPKITYTDDFKTKMKKNRILSELSESMDDNTTYVAGIGDVFPASVADTEFGKLLPKLADGTLTPEEFCQELTQKAEEAKQ